jgi:hypothetical protein
VFGLPMLEESRSTQKYLFDEQPVRGSSGKAYGGGRGFLVHDGVAERAMMRWQYSDSTRGIMETSMTIQSTKAYHDSVDQRDSAIAVAQRQQASRERATYEAGVRSNKWPPKITRAVLNHEVLVGMTDTQVWAAWGAPERRTSTTTASGERVLWVYSAQRYVSFNNGRVTAIQR